MSGVFGDNPNPFWSVHPDTAELHPPADPFGCLQQATGAVHVNRPASRRITQLGGAVIEHVYIPRKVGGDLPRQVALVSGHAHGMHRLGKYLTRQHPHRVAAPDMEIGQATADETSASGNRYHEPAIDHRQASGQ
jgi:hypothetical protein